MNKKYKAKYPVQTVEKAIEILMYLKDNAAQRGLSLNEISEGTGMGKSGVHRFLDTLLEYDFVEKSKDGLSYKLGWGAFELGCNVPKYNGIESEKITSLLSELSNYFGEIINLGINNSNSMIIIKRFFPDRKKDSSKLITNVSIGERECLYCTGIGKLFMSKMKKEDMIMCYRSEKGYRPTEFAIQDEERFIEEIESIKELGYAVDDRESSLEIICIAVPIMDYSGNIVAGISISVPYGRINKNDISSVAEKMKEEALKISYSLGYN